MAFTCTQRLALAVVPRVAALLIRALGATLRYEDTYATGGARGDLIPGPGIYAFWHRSLLASAHRFRDKNMAILISSSFDGELIARTVERLGFLAIRGSSSRGGATGLRNLRLAYRAGHRCAFTADGPRGPAMKLKSGPVQLARLVDAPWIGSFYVAPERAWTLKTWDSFQIPKPFSRVVISWPQHVSTESRGDDALEAQLQQALDQAVALADGHRANP